MKQYVAKTKYIYMKISAFFIKDSHST